MSDDFTNLDNDDAYRHLAKELHPDHGGSPESMRALNELHEQVKAARKFQFGKNAAQRPDIQVEVEEPGPNQDAFILVPIDGTMTPFPRQAAERILKMSPEELADFQRVRNLARTDTIFCGNTMLGMNLSENPHRSFVNFFVHRQVGMSLGDLDPDYKRRLLLAPRGSAKTTFVRADIFSWILLFPNIRVVFLSGSENLAVPQLQAIAKGFSQPTPAMLKYFPEYCYLPRSKWNKKQGCWKDVLVGDAIGTMHHFSVPNRTAVHPEPTFQIATPEAVSSGLHSELVYADDIVNNQTRTVEAHKKAFQNYLDVLPIVMPAGYLHVSGTRYRGGAEPDAYGRVMNRAQKESRWKFMVEDCYSTNCNTVLENGMMCGRPECMHDRQINAVQGPSIPGIPGVPCLGFHSDGIVVPFCPVVECKDGEYGYTMDFLEMQKNSDLNFFALQYMNDPSLIQKAKSIFNEQTFGRQTLHTQEQILLKFPPQDSQIFMMVDPAYSDAEFGERRDETVILIFSRRGGDIIFWNSFSGQWGARERTQQIVNAIKTYRPVTCFIESNINAESAEILIMDSAHAAGLINVPIASRVPKRARGSRTIRMENAAQLLETGRVWLYGALPNYQKLVQQAMEYPDGQHDDAIDCFAQAIEAAVEVLFLLNTPSTGMPAPNTGGGNWLRRLNAPREIESDGTNDGSLFCMTIAVEPASRSHRARLTQVNYALHEASHAAASVYRNLPTSVAIRSMTVACGDASGMTWSVGGTVADDLFVLSAGLAGSKYFHLGEAGCLQDRHDITSYGRDAATLRSIQAEADIFVADHVDTILKLAYVLSWTGGLTEEQTKDIWSGKTPVIVPKAFLDSVQQILKFDWVLPTCKITNKTQAISSI